MKINDDSDSGSDYTYVITKSPIDANEEFLDFYKKEPFNVKALSSSNIIVKIDENQIIFHLNKDPAMK